jgi:rubrerythrin
MKEFKNINDILDFAINAEQEAVDFYNNLSEKLTNEAMRKVFVQFAQEEMGHKAKLLSIKEKGQFNISAEKVMDLKISDYVVTALPSSNMSYQEALMLAMNKEKAAFKLYLGLSEKAPNNDLKNFFLMLAQEESKHKLRFEIEYDEHILKEN